MSAGVQLVSDDLNVLSNIKFQLQPMQDVAIAGHA